MNNQKNILLIGATSGIGSAIAKLLPPGCSLFLTGRDEIKLAALQMQLPNTSVVIGCDLTVENNIQKLAEACTALDGFVFCAGIAPTLPIKYIREENIRQTMSVNFESAVLVTSALMKQKKINAGASLVFLSSEAVRHPFFGSTLYSASKAALESFALSLANELQPKKIRSNCISPAYVETPMLDHARAALSEEFIGSMKKMHPEAFSPVEKIAALAAFLLSDNSTSINGQILQAGRFNINIPGL